MNVDFYLGSVQIFVFFLAWFTIFKLHWLGIILDLLRFFWLPTCLRISYMIQEQKMENH